MGTHLRELGEGYLMNANMTGFTVDDFQKSLHTCALDKSSLSIGRVNPFMHTASWTHNMGIIFFMLAFLSENIWRKNAKNV